MTVLYWLAIPVVVTVIAMIWIARGARIATPEQQQQGIAELERMREALAKPLPKHPTE